MAPTAFSDRDRFLAFAFAASDLLIELDHEGRVAFLAGSCQSLMGCSSEEAQGQPFMDFIAERDHILAERCLHQLKKIPRVGPIQLQFSRSQAVVSLRGLCAAPGNPYSLAVRNLDPGTYRILDSDIDDVSGLIQPNAFERLVAQHALDSRNSGRPSDLNIVQLIGLGGFAGDGGTMTDVMKHVGGILRSLSFDGRSAGRLGEDSFGLITDRRTEADIGQDLQDAMREHGFEGAKVKVETIAIGGNTLTEQEANKALGHVMRAYAGKVDGATSFVSLDEALRQSYEDTAKRISDFRRTVEQLRFQLHYQPIVKLADGTISHFEALSRFRGVESPFEMINFAEDVGITTEFDLAVVRKILEQLETRAAAKNVPKIAINLSTRSLDQDSFVDKLLSILQNSGAIANNLAFEITESAEIKNLERMAKVIERIQKRGHAVALDDFGAGAAAFHYIRALKVDYVKLDGAYISQLLNNERDATIVSAMVEMCRSLKVGTIAEMVETEDQANFLTRLGVDCAQGYLYAKPSPSLDIPSPIQIPSTS